MAEHLFQTKQAPDLSFLEHHLSPNPIAEQTFSHENTPSHEQQPEQHQPEPQPQP
ncbi:hypothetical protein A2U01_0098819, partial [Trifolium medium]|nr:hypothetical protein [Trifolium medium]